MFSPPKKEKNISQHVLHFSFQEKAKLSWYASRSAPRPPDSPPPAPPPAAALITAGCSGISNVFEGLYRKRWQAGWVWALS